MMDVTELAHWRYRIQALTHEIPFTESMLHDARKLANLGITVDPYWQKESQRIQGQLDFEKYLLEEAKYKVMVGETLRVGDTVWVAETNPAVQPAPKDYWVNGHLSVHSSPELAQSALQEWADKHPEYGGVVDLDVHKMRVDA